MLNQGVLLLVAGGHCPGERASVSDVLRFGCDRTRFATLGAVHRRRPNTGVSLPGSLFQCFLVMLCRWSKQNQAIVFHMELILLVDTRFSFSLVLLCTCLHYPTTGSPTECGSCAYSAGFSLPGYTSAAVQWHRSMLISQALPSPPAWTSRGRT